MQPGVVLAFIRRKQKRLKTYSLRTQIIASIALLTILSVTIVGLTALWINYRYLDNAKRQQSLSMVSSFYQAQENKLADLVVLTSVNLAFDGEDKLYDPNLLQDYLTQVHTGMPKIDTMIVCDDLGNLIIIFRQYASY